MAPAYCALAAAEAGAGGEAEAFEAGAVPVARGAVVVEAVEAFEAVSLSLILNCPPFERIPYT